MTIDRIIGIITAVIMLTGLSVVVARRSNTAAVLDTLIGGFTTLQKTVLSPLASPVGGAS